MRDRFHTARFSAGLLCGALSAALFVSTSTARATDWLVLPFANLSDEPALDWLGEGFALSLEEHLQAGGQKTVPYDQTREVLSEWNVPRGRAVTQATALKAAERTGSTRVVTGSFTIAEGELSVECQVVDPLGPEVLGNVRDRVRLGELLNLHAGLARAVWRAGRKQMPAFRPLDETVEGPPLAAYEQYVRARIEGEPGKRLQHLRQAALSFPTYALLQYRLAEALNDAGRPEEALRALERLHPARFILTPAAYLLEGELHFRREDPQAAGLAVRSALDTQDSAQGRLLHAEILLAGGRKDEARAELERSRELGLAAEEFDEMSRKLEAEDSGPQP